MAKLHFYGGAKSVTGSNYLVETENSKVLVDCGLFQGSKEADEENYKDFPYNPAGIDAVFITHAHIDHLGRVPKLIKDGYNGPIYGTEPTAELAPVMLYDSQGIIEHQAESEEEILYSKEDVDKTKKYFKGVKYNTTINVTDDITVRLKEAGHILGSAVVEIWVKEGTPPRETKLVFSGDLGNPPTPLLNPYDFVEDADYILVESVYGDRVHEDKEERKRILEVAIEDTATYGGTLLIPAFALERTQEVLFELNSLVEYNRIPEVPIFIDSPLAIDATQVYKKFSGTPYFNEEAVWLKRSGDELFHFPRLKFTYETEESKAINGVEPPKVILAGSGMSTGGRILHHEIRYLPDPKSMILFIGYQAKNTLGRRIFEGADEVNIFGEKVSVNARKRAIGGYSSHADRNMLLDWIDRARKNSKDLKKVFCVQGEEEASTALATQIRDKMAVDAESPDQGDVLEF